MTQNIEELRELVSAAIDNGQSGKIKACKSALRDIYSIIKNDPFLLWEDSYVSQLGKAIIMMIHWDMIDDEDENIGLAHLAYLYISKAIEKEENLQPESDKCELFRLRKDRIIIMKSFDDFFVESLQNFYFADNKATDLDTYNEQRKAVLSRLPFMQFSDIYLIEQDYPNLRDDEFLLELANMIEHDQEFTNENLKEAFLLHKILYKFTYEELKKGELVY
ncbi:hypothetical protein DF185_01915 [Marinifilum breve]|uniref:Uncharacterized protein n=1 Tax=Marinifilum breve TaxID=2184082 RepID=A0A2V4AFK2_9BACT|nr:hypothetical protein [Marinifilum breve]PXY02874.1 hypothetical protein DF185_01915 [Marinifilum breve]